jgi:hypothetical protein
LLLFGRVSLLDELSKACTHVRIFIHCPCTASSLPIRCLFAVYSLPIHCLLFIGHSSVLPESTRVSSILDPHLWSTTQSAEFSGLLSIHALCLLYVHALSTIPLFLLYSSCIPPVFLRIRRYLNAGHVYLHVRRPDCSDSSCAIFFWLSRPRFLSRVAMSLMFLCAITPTSSCTFSFSRSVAPRVS